MSMPISTATPSAASASVAVAQTARAVDGDFKARSASTSQVKDADGDYKPASVAAPKASSAVQSALLNLAKGG